VEIRIGVQGATRELVMDVSLTADDVSKAVSDALRKTENVLDLVDERGRRVLVPGDKIAFVEIGEPEVRRVGFAAI
jgi:hypothetical protein